MTNRRPQPARIAKADAAATARHARSSMPDRPPGWIALALRTWTRSSEDNIGLIAAGVAFYTFLALLPLLGATVLTYGLIATPQTVQSNVQTLATIMPPEAATLVGEQLMGVIATSGGKKGLGLLLALAIAVFGARNAAGSVITALNIAYETRETRGFVAVNALAIGMTGCGIVIAIVAMVSVAAVGHVEQLIPGLPAALLLVGRLLSYFLLIGGAAAGAAALYRFAPDHDAHWRWITPGSVLASVGWVALTLGFGLYAANIADYGKTYGSLATVVVLLTWVYLSVYLLLLGAELNAELDRKPV